MKVLNTSIVVSADGSSYASYRIPGIVCTGKGTLIACYEARNSLSDWSVIDLCAKRSVDGGRTWQQPQLLFSGQGKNTTNNPVMFADGELIHLICLENYKRMFYRVSADDGVTWSEPLEITSVLDEARGVWPWTCAATGPGHGVRLSGGRLIVPMWLASDPGNIFAHSPARVAMLYSDDRGKSWRLGEIFVPEGARSPNETCLAERPDGSVLLSIRSRKPEGSGSETPHYRYMAVSENGVSGWKTWLEKQLPDPACAAGMCNCPRGILFTHCSDYTARRELTLRLSEDGGASWGDSVMYAELGGYSDCVFSPETGTAFVIYEQKGETEIRVSEIEL